MQFEIHYIVFDVFFGHTMKSGKCLPWTDPLCKTSCRTLLTGLFILMRKLLVEAI